MWGKDAYCQEVDAPQGHLRSARRFNYTPRAGLHDHPQIRESLGARTTPDLIPSTVSGQDIKEPNKPLKKKHYSLFPLVNSYSN